MNTKNIKNKIGFIVAAFLLFVTATHATVLFPSGGGTGTSTIPSFGKVLVGNSFGTYSLVATSSLGISGGGGGSPGGNQYDVQLNDGSGGFSGSDNINFQGGYLTINGDSGYGQLQWLNSPLTGGYAGAGISGTDNEIIVGGLAGDMNFWSSQAMNLSADAGGTDMLRINTDGGVQFSQPIQDTSASASIDTNNRIAYAPDGTTKIIDWTNIYNPLAALSFTADQAVFASTIKSSGDPYPSIDTNARYLIDNTGVVSTDWLNRVLYAADGNTKLVDFTNTTNTFAALSFDIGSAVFNAPIQATDNTKSVDTNSRLLYDSGGSTVIIDYSDTFNAGAALSFTSGGYMIPRYGLADTSSNATIFTDERVLVASDGSTNVIAWNPAVNNAFTANYWFDSNNSDRITGDGSGLTGILAVNANYLYDTAGTPLIAADGVNRVLYAPNGTSQIIDWTNTANANADISFNAGAVYFGGAGTYNAVIDGSGNISGLSLTLPSGGFLEFNTGSTGIYATNLLSIDPANRILYASDGTTPLFDYSGNTTSAPYHFTSGILQGNGSGLTSLQSGNLTGSLPAIDGSALTNITQTQVNTASSVTGESYTANFDCLTPGSIDSQTFVNGVETSHTTC